MVSRMIKKGIPIFLFFLLVFISFHPIQAEKIGFRFSYNLLSTPKGDLDTWIASYNSLWEAWKAKKGGSVQGEFKPLDFGPTYEAEIRIPIVAGFALCLEGSYLSSKSEGTIDYNNQAGNQQETHFLLNDLKAFPLKIGLGFSYPVFNKFSVLAAGGRHIIFVSYKTQEKYEAKLLSSGSEFFYWFNKDVSYHSEALGYFASLGVQYDILPYLAVGVEAEKIWSKVDGFKGSYSYKDYTGRNEDGKASLYFYESNEWGLNQYFPVLYGQKDKPEGSSVRNVRQGEFNFSSFAFKIGLTFKF
jgi:hypothetical protein